MVESTRLLAKAGCKNRCVIRRWKESRRTGKLSCQGNVFCLQRDCCGKSQRGYTEPPGADSRESPRTVKATCLPITFDVTWIQVLLTNNHERFTADCESGPPGSRPAKNLDYLCAVRLKCGLLLSLSRQFWILAGPCGRHRNPPRCVGCFFHRAF